MPLPGLASAQSQLNKAGAPSLLIHEPSQQTSAGTSSILVRWKQHPDIPSLVKCISVDLGESLLVLSSRTQFCQISLMQRGGRLWLQMQRRKFLFPFAMYV